MTSIQERLRAFRTDSKPLHVQQNERGEVYDYTIHKYTPRVCHEAANVIDGLVKALEAVRPYIEAEAAARDQTAIHNMIQIGTALASTKCESKS